MRVEIVIDGFAQAQRPPQAAIVPPLPPALRKRHHVMVHTPAEVRKWQITAKSLAIEQMKGHNPMVGMLDVNIRVYLPVPLAMSKKKQALALSGAIRPITRPDCDNYSKSICDSLNQVAWRDDAQIVQLSVGKWYSLKPRVEIEVREIAYPLEALPVMETGVLFDGDKP